MKESSSLPFHAHQINNGTACLYCGEPDMHSQPEWCNSEDGVLYEGPRVLVADTPTYNHDYTPVTLDE